jgi:hypothetical protein
MSTRATIPFEVTGWNETPWDEPTEGPRLARATVRKVFRGDLEGESVAELLLCHYPADFSAGAGYVASERITGRLGGRTGTFVLQHSGLSGGAGDAADGSIVGHVVPGSGTGELAGLRGTARITQAPDGKHTLTLDYSFLVPAVL